MRQQTCVVCAQKEGNWVSHSAVTAARKRVICIPHSIIWARNLQFSKGIFRGRRKKCPLIVSKRPRATKGGRISSLSRFGLAPGEETQKDTNTDRERAGGFAIYGRLTLCVVLLLLRLQYTQWWSIANWRCCCCCICYCNL